MNIVCHALLHDNIPGERTMSKILVTGEGREAPNSNKALLAEIRDIWASDKNRVEDLVHRYVMGDLMGAGLPEWKDTRICVAAGNLLGVARNLPGDDVAGQFTEALERLVNEWKVRKWPIVDTKH